MTEPADVPEILLRKAAGDESATRALIEATDVSDDMIRFVDGPAGRRAALVGGPDVCEAIELIQENEGDLAAAAEYLRKPVGALQAAVSYYGAYPDEIDEWIEANRREAEEARVAFLAGQAALSR